MSYDVRLSIPNQTVIPYYEGTDYSDLAREILNLLSRDIIEVLPAIFGDIWHETTEIETDEGPCKQTALRLRYRPSQELSDNALQDLELYLVVRAYEDNHTPEYEVIAKFRRQVIDLADNVYPLTIIDSVNEDKAMLSPEQEIQVMRLTIQLNLMLNKLLSD
jgi:hypothetical protein